MAGGEGSGEEEKSYMENKILAKLIQSIDEAGDLKDWLVVIGQAEDLCRRGCYASSA